MGILECASRASVWKGFDCYAQEKVLRLDEIGEDMFRAEVSGSEDNVYEVELNAEQASADPKHMRIHMEAFSLFGGKSHYGPCPSDFALDKHTHSAIIMNLP